MLELNEFLEILKIKPDELGINYLEREIERLKNLSVSAERAEQRDQFLQSVENLRRHIFNGFVQLLSPFCKYKILPNGDVHVLAYYGNSHEIKTKAINSSTAQVLRDTATTLKNLTYQPENVEQDSQYLVNFGKKYETMCQQYPRFKNFWVGVASVALSGIGFIVGAGLGALRGFFKGLKYVLVGSLFTTPYYAAKGAIEGVLAANEFGKKLAGEPPVNSTGRNLTFRAPAIESSAVSMAKIGATFFQQPKEVLKQGTVTKPEASTTHTSQVQTGYKPSY